ncbi:MAG: glycosyltransferase family 4 protein, partial [Candidatus Limnocylindria bacterium]
LLVPRSRVLQLLATGGTGGAQESAIALLLHLDRSRFEVEAVCLAEGRTVERLRDLGIPVIVIPAQDDESTVHELAAYLRRRKIDLLHAHLFRAELLGTRAAPAAGTPVVVATAHSSRVRSAADRAALAAVTPSIDRLIVPSAAIAAKARAEGRGGAEITVVPNGVDLDRFSPHRSSQDMAAGRAGLGIPPDAFLIGVVARLEPEKGHRYLLEALPAIIEAVPNAWLLLVGEGSQTDALRARAGSLPLAARQRVVIAGFQTDVEAVTQALDVAVMPSLREAQGLTLLEAMAAERPVVASAVGGIPETVRDGKDGLLVPPADPGALATAIIRLARDARLRDRLTASGRRRVEDQFTVAASVRRVESIYEEELVRAGVLAASGVVAPSSVSDAKCHAATPTCRAR